MVEHKQAEKIDFQGRVKAIEEKLQELLTMLAEKKNIHHAVIAVESGGKDLSWIGARGKAGPDGSPMTPETPFWTASITKLYIAATIFILQEQGKLSLDGSLSSFFPGELIRGIHRKDGVDYSQKLTLRQLLGHASGLPDYIILHRKGEKSFFDAALEDGDRSWSIEDILDLLRDVNKPLFAPQDMGKRKKKVSYSDSNFQLLIAVIETLTGKKISRVFQELIFQPLGLEKTFHPEKPPAGGPEKVATVWYKDEPLEIPGALASFNDISSTARDLLDFMRALVNGRVFARKETFEEMIREWNQFGLSFSPVGPGWPIEYGLGIMRFRIPRLISPFQALPEIIGHTGATGSWLFYCPAWDLYLAGNVSQLAASPLPFRLVPRILKEINSIGR